MTDIEMLQKEIQGFIDNPTQETATWASICLKKLSEIATPLGMDAGKKSQNEILQTPTADTVGAIASRLGSEVRSINKLGDSYYRIVLADPQNDAIKKNIGDELEAKKKPGIFLDLLFTPGAKIPGRKNESNTR